jgi:hypothetical protein
MFSFQFAIENMLHVLQHFALDALFGSNLNPQLKPPIRCTRNMHSQVLTPMTATNARSADISCCICMSDADEMNDPVRVTTCQHVFCRECISTWLAEKAACPVCKKSTVWYTGNQPPGRMRVKIIDGSMTCFERHKTIVMTFHIPAGFSKTGMAHNSMYVTAYLPDNEEGQHCMKLLRAAFNQRLLFKLEGSNVVPNSIELKTHMRGLEHDVTYFYRLREDLSKVDIV